MQEWAQTLGAIVAALAALSALVMSWRRARPEMAKLKADSEVGFAGTVKGLLENLESLRKQLNVTRAKENECEEQLEHATDEIAKMKERISALESAAPMVMMSLKLQTVSADLARVLNKCRDGIVLTVPQEEGRFVWCNTAFASALGMTPEEIIVAGWRSLINPAHVEATDIAETHAWQSGGEVVNQYRHKLGHYVTLRWFFTEYMEGSALSVVWFDRRRRDSSPTIQNVEN